MPKIKKTNNYWQLSYIYQEIMTRMDTKDVDAGNGKIIVSVNLANRVIKKI